MTPEKFYDFLIDKYGKEESKRLKKAIKLMQKYKDECGDDEWDCFDDEHFVDFLMENDLV